MSWVVAGIFALWIVIFLAIERRRLRTWLSRESSLAEWQSRFPDRGPERIVDFLNEFVECFGLARKHAARFRPDDTLTRIYQALYPPKWSFADGLEYETLAMRLKERYQIELETVLRDDLTLGELLAHLRS